MTDVKPDYREITGHFLVKGKVSSVEPLGEGFINDTLKVFVEGRDDPAYILQRKNHVVFPDVPAMMENIRKVTSHIHSRGAETITLVNTPEGVFWWRDTDGNYWTITEFNAGTVSPSVADTPDLAFQGGKGLGTFHRLMADFNEPLAETIKGFHNMKWRFSQWDEALKRDAAGRASSLAEEISWIESRRDAMLAFRDKFDTGVFPVRVTHNDTKISNFLFDAASGELRCAIDLDTTMNGTWLNDVGDALRSYTNTGAEDDRNPDKVGMSMEMYKAWMSGYLSETKGLLVPAELENLAFSGLYITFEQVLRFLMDYIDGDKYYKTAYPEHNLVRTRAQYRLLCSMEEQYSEMNAFVADSCA